MKLQCRIFLILGGCALLFGGMLLWVTDRFVRSGFGEVERREILADLDQARTGIRRSVDEVRSIVGDWAPWTETYLFLLDRNPSYPKENLPAASYVNLRVDEVILLDSSGRVLYARGYDRLRGGFRGPSASLIRLARESSLPREGLALADGVPVSFAIEAVLKSDFRGPSSGRILMARRLDPAALRRIGEGSGVPDLSLVSPFSGAGGNFAPEVRILSDDRIAASALLIGADGRPLGRLEVRSSRPIMDTADRTMVMLLETLPAALLGMALMAALFLRRAVIRPVLGLARWVEQLLEGGIFRGPEPPRIEGEELARLTESVVALRDSFLNFSATLPVPVLLCNEEGRILLCGGAPGGNCSADSVGLLATDLCLEGGKALARAMLEARAGWEPAPVRLRLAQGEAGFPAEARIRRFTLGARPILLVSLLDLTERDAYEERLARTAYLDDLTGLPNRVRFLERLREVLTPGGSGFAALVLLDLDRFRAVNDRFGQGGGDLFLMDLAGRLSAAFPDPGGERVFRMEGDRFALLLPPEWAKEGPPVSVEDRIAQVLREVAERPIGIAGASLPVSLSSGLVPALLPGEGRVESALLDAELALKAAKGAGFGRTRVIDEAIREENRSRATLAAELQRGIEEREFVLLYQPICALGSGKAQGFEALIRWDAPGRGRLSPDRFIPEAERNGLILPLGSWILDEGIAAARRLREKTGRSLYVSINVSTSQLLEKDFALRLGERLRTNELPGDALLLEITESVFAADAATVRNTLGEVRHLGVPVALDDFGTGYSSLGYLNRLPVDRVKIDKSFLAPLARGEGAPVAAAVLALARNLGLSVVAEGVETDFQRRWLRARGCRFGQGWFFAKALEEAAAVEYAFRERIPDKPEAAS
jgi:diguanylate cyclase (GGDEF)-like protein